MVLFGFGGGMCSTE